jgi:hypothetical protein
VLLEPVELLALETGSRMATAMGAMATAVGALTGAASTVAEVTAAEVIDPRVV